MSVTSRLAAVTLAALMLAACEQQQEPAQPQAEGRAEFATDQERYSYAIGFQLGNNLRERIVDVDPTMLAKGLEESLTEAAPRLSDEEFAAALRGYDQQQQQKLAARAEAAAEEGRAFLERNRESEDVRTTESGLQYRVLNQGEGRQPTAEDIVLVHYRGTLLDGTEFDSSYTRGEPVRLPVAGVIPGWQEALQMMQPGSKWTIFVPAELAYGAQGAGDVIGPNQALIFDIELLEVEEQASAIEGQ